jgi:hypothetical protein
MPRRSLQRQEKIAKNLQKTQGANISRKRRRKRPSRHAASCCQPKLEGNDVALTAEKNRNQEGKENDNEGRGENARQNAA